MRRLPVQRHSGPACAGLPRMRSPVSFGLLLRQYKRIKSEHVIYFRSCKFRMVGGLSRGRVQHFCPPPIPSRSPPLNHAAWVSQAQPMGNSSFRPIASGQPRLDVWDKLRGASRAQENNLARSRPYPEAALSFRHSVLSPH